MNNPGRVLSGQAEPPSPEASAPESQWAMTKSTDRIEARLLTWPVGYELQLLRRGERYVWRRFEHRDQAIAFGAEARHLLMVRGWRAARLAIHHES